MPQIAEITNIVLERLTTVFVIVNRYGHIEFVSPSVTKILGFEPMLLHGDNWWRLTRDTDAARAAAKAYVLSLLRDENTTSGTFENVLKTAMGGRKWMLWNYSKGPDDTLVVVGNDITERKIAEQQLQIKNKELLAKNTEIIDSIQYAKRIQRSVLPDVDAIKSSLSDAFVLYHPKDIVSGDFYWHYEKGNKVFVAAIDCTGHGVPGALMSILANSLLRDIIVKRGVESASEILHLIDDEIAVALRSEGGNPTADGMDIALCVFDKETDTLEFSGAFRPLLQIRGGAITEYKGNRFPIGFYQDVQKEFKSETISLQKGDMFYIFSDGYIDQFGGENNKKLNKVRFKELLQTVQGMDLDEQEAFLEYSLRNWQQDTEQTDDVLVIGLRY